MKKYLLLSLLSGLLACSEIENVDVFIEAPAVVQLNDDFDVVVKLVNSASKPQELYSIDISNHYLTGVMVLKTEPEYKESTRIPIDNTTSYVYKQELLPGDTVKVTISCKAIDLGDFKGDFDFCINSDFNFMSKQVRTIVRTNE